MIWNNELYVWGLITSAFFLVPLMLAAKIFPTRKSTASLILLLALAGIAFTGLATIRGEHDLRLTKTVDHLELWKLWYNGPGLVPLIVIILFAICYVGIAMRRGKRGQRSE